MAEGKLKMKVMAKTKLLVAGSFFLHAAACLHASAKENVTPSKGSVYTSAGLPIMPVNRLSRLKLFLYQQPHFRNTAGARSSGGVLGYYQHCYEPPTAM